MGCRMSSGRPRLPPLPQIPRPPGLARVDAEPAAPSPKFPLAVGTSPMALFNSADVASQLRDLEDKLARCLSSLSMHFQPIVHAGTRARFGYEALIRSIDKALPHPGAILDAAERLERVPTVGRAVRAQTAKVLASAPPERGVVFVNLHLLDFYDKQLTSPFAPLSKVASRVVLEITERTSVDGEDDLRYRVAQLRELFGGRLDDPDARFELALALRSEPAAPETG